MKNSRALVNERRVEILNALEKNEKVSVRELSQILGVSALTVRRDIAALAANRHIDRFHGRVALFRPEEPGHVELVVPEENIFSSGLTANKLAIAKYAAGLVEDGDTIFINTRSTAISMLPYIQARQVTVITNNVRAIEFEHRDDMNLVFTGGEIRFPKESMVGTFAVSALSKVTASKCFLGCNGVNAEEGVTTAVLPEATINGMMLTRANKRYILADKSKVGRRLNFLYGGIRDIHTLITDTEANPAELALIRKSVEVVQVGVRE
jgi:DeoR/GlpR family transcriptional regulator of sugar metabolism